MVLIIMIVVATFLLAIELTVLVLYINKVKSSPILPVACAGSEKANALKEMKLVNLDWNKLRDANNAVLNISEFMPFVTMGQSMLLGGIQDKDIVLVNKHTDIQTMNLPAIVMLRREEAAMLRAERFNDRAEYKIRRSWSLNDMSDSDENILNVVRNIIQRKEFQKLRILDEEKFPDEEQLIEDFEKRLRRYREEHVGCEQQGNEHNKVLVSTTLDTQRGRVHFSIHSCQMVVGKVEYAFGINQYCKAA